MAVSCAGPGLATISLPTNGAYRLEVVRDSKLDELAGTLPSIGVGGSWEEARSLNKAQQCYTLR